MATKINYIQYYLDKLQIIYIAFIHLFFKSLYLSLFGG